jgi:hypothetical protein
VTARLGTSLTKRRIVVRYYHRSHHGLASCLAALACLVAGAGNARANGVARPEVPATLEVDPGYRPYLVGHAVGTQNYVCLPKAGGFGWVLYGPQATLFDDDGRQIATHFLSPNPDESGVPRATWQHARDTSALWAKAIADPVTVEADAIPWLLLGVVGSDRGPDADGSRLVPSAFIQRVHTAGGMAPTTGCGAATDVGAKALVPYAADYYFYRARGR